MFQFLAPPLTLNGLILAALYFIMARSFLLIVDLMPVANMIHGPFPMVGASPARSIWDTTGGYSDCSPRRDPRWRPLKFSKWSLNIFT